MPKLGTTAAQDMVIRCALEQVSSRLPNGKKKVPGMRRAMPCCSGCSRKRHGVFPGIAHLLSLCRRDACQRNPRWLKDLHDM